jgi:hypothetical protein
MPRFALASSLSVTSSLVASYVAAGGQVGLNSVIGSSGPYTISFINNSGRSLVVVVWGLAGSWVNVNQPLLTYGLADGQSLDTSYDSGASGAFAGYFADTELVNGQVSNTWGEFTFDDPYSTFDVSREVNMSGRSLVLSGFGCTSNMDTCVFRCTDGSNSCLTSYSLFNCASGSQPGAGTGNDDGAPSGGCTGSFNGSGLAATFT